MNTIIIQSPTTTSRNRQHWYRRFIGECPMCGRDKSYRKREYGARPENINNRTTYLSDTFTYDYCDAWPL